MTIVEDVYLWLGDFRGVLGWGSFTEVYTGAVYPWMEIPLYVKSATIPMRKPTVTDIVTVPTTDSAKYDTTIGINFWGSPTMLQTELSGWTVTPVAGGAWAPVDVHGNPTFFGPVSYNDIITFYLAGRYNRNLAGAWQRKDPDYYTSPKGEQYLDPIIQVWNPQATPIQKKQAFDMTLLLET